MSQNSRIPLTVVEPSALADVKQPERNALVIVDGALGDNGAPENWMHVTHLVSAQAQPLPTHGAGCACCFQPARTATLLMGLFQQRARSEVGFFSAATIVAPPGRGSEIRDAVARDVFAMAYYQMGR